MKTLSVDMAAALSSGAPRLVKMLQLVLRDGTIMGFTDHDSDLEFDLDDGLGAVVYSAGSGVLVSDLELSAGLAADNFEFSGPIRAAGPITLPAVLGGRFNNARAKLFEVRWSDLDAGAIAWLSGDVHQARPEGAQFTAEIRNQLARYSQVIGRLIINSCDADHGDARCKRIVETEDLTVTAAVDALEFSATYAGDWADGFFDKGKVYAITGTLAGTAPVEVERWDQTAPGAAVIRLSHFLAEAPQVGDTFEIRRGCGKTRAACMERGNMINFRGKPDVPGTDQIARMPTPGGGGA